jgi:hypothetical protein
MLAQFVPPEIIGPLRDRIPPEPARPNAPNR